MIFFYCSSNFLFRTNLLNTNTKIIFVEGGGGYPGLEYADGVRESVETPPITHLPTPILLTIKHWI